MRHVVVFREHITEDAIYGTLRVVEDGDILYSCKTIENAHKACPDGKFAIKLEYSPRFKCNLWELYGTQGRSEIKIHVANYWNQLDGCIGVGLRHQDLNHDGIIDIAQSKQALAQFHEVMKGTESEVIINKLYAK